MEIPGKKKLRVGILINDFWVPNWIYLVVEKINESNYAEFVLVVKKTSGTGKKNRGSFTSRIKSNFRFIAYIIFKKVEDKMFKPAPSAFTVKDMQPLLSRVPLLEVSPVEKKFSDTFLAEDITKIKGYEIDVFLRFGFRILKGDILSSSKFGVWSYHHGDNRVNRGGAPGIWESIEGWRETGFILQILTEDLDAGKVLYRSWSQKELSINRNLHNLYWKAMPVMPMKLKELYETGADRFMKKVAVENQHPEFYSNRLYSAPTNGELISRLFHQYVKWAKYKCWLMFNFRQWILLYCFNNEEKPATSIFRFKRLTPPKDRFWADPCVVYKNNTYYIFMEELIYKENAGKAHIAVIEMDYKGNYKQPEIALKLDYHLSYPFVFDYRNECYMVPETINNSTIELYRSVGFPTKWEFVMNLQENIKTVDTTFFEKDGKVWMFTYQQENKDVYVFELFLYYADDLLTDNWISHPLNPVVSDIKSARPAGSLFFHNEKLYRSSQDCSYLYGYATVINEVITMTTDEYVEVPVTNILPNWSKDVIATHSLSWQKKLTVIDAFVKRRK